MNVDPSRTAGDEAGDQPQTAGSTPVGRHNAQLQAPAPFAVEIFFFAAGLFTAAAVLFARLLMDPFTLRAEYVFGGVLLAAVNFRLWALFVRTSSFPEERKVRRRRIVLFLTGKAALVLGVIWLVLHAGNELILSLLVGFIGYILGGLLLTAGIFLVSNRKVLLSVNDGKGANGNAGKSAESERTL